MEEEALFCIESALVVWAAQWAADGRIGTGDQTHMTSVASSRCHRVLGGGRYMAVSLNGDLRCIPRSTHSSNTPSASHRGPSCCLRPISRRHGHRARLVLRSSSRLTLRPTASGHGSQGDRVVVATCADIVTEESEHPPSSQAASEDKQTGEETR